MLFDVCLSCSFEEQASLVNKLFDAWMTNGDEIDRQKFIDNCLGVNALALVELSLTTGINYLAILDPDSTREKFTVNLKVIEALLKLIPDDDRSIWLSLTPFLDLDEKDSFKIMSVVFDQLKKSHSDGDPLEAESLSEVKIHPICQENLYRYVQVYNQNRTNFKVTGSFDLCYSYLMYILSLQAKPTKYTVEIFSEQILSEMGMRMFLYTREMAEFWAEVRREIKSRPDYSISLLYHLLDVDMKEEGEIYYRAYLEEDLLECFRFDPSHDDFCLHSFQYLSESARDSTRAELLSLSRSGLLELKSVFKLLTRHSRISR
jgi:hypothetical protein